MKVCIRTHHSATFGEVPAGSLWEDGHEVVAENPRAFRRDGAPLDDDPDEVEVED